MEIRADGLDGAGTVVGDFYHGSGGTSKAGLEILHSVSSVVKSSFFAYFPYFAV